MKRISERRSIPLLVFGVFFVLLNFPPFSRFQEYFHVPSFVSSLAFRLAQPLCRTRSDSASSDHAGFDAKTLCEHESQKALPADASLQSRCALFVSVLRRDLAQNTLILDAGSDDGVEVGMAALMGNDFVGIVGSVEAQRSTLRLASDPELRLSVRTDQTRFIARGNRGNRLRVEMPSQRSFQEDETVWVDPSTAAVRDASAGAVDVISSWDRGMEAARGAELGKIRQQERSSRSGFWVQWEVEPATIQSLWLLSGNPRAKRQLVPAKISAERLAARVVSQDLSPNSNAFLISLDAQEADSVKVGDAVLSGDRCVGRIAKIQDRFAWVRSLADSRCEFEQLLLGQDGSILTLGKPSFRRLQQHELCWARDRKDMKEGGLFTACGDARVPKGLFLGRVFLDQGRFQIEDLDLSGLSAVQVLPAGSQP